MLVIVIQQVVGFVFEIEIDTHLDKETYTKTLLHEMFHMKQFIDGTLKTKWSKMYYKNEPVENYSYDDQPHEIEKSSRRKFYIKNT